MTDSKLIKSFVEQYHLKTGGIKFWTPYFINSRALSPDPEHFKPGPFKGKGTPRQIQSWVNSYLKHHQAPRSAGEWREVLLKNGVGVECSGFAYYVLDSFLRTKGLGRLWDYIFIPKTDLVEGLKQRELPEGMSKEKIESYPDNISLHRFCEEWGKSPTRNTNVKRLVSEAATVPVNKASELVPGDLIYMQGPAGDHVGVILSNDGQKVEYADSIGYGLKGVSLYSARIVNPNKNIWVQDWGKDKWYLDRYEFLSMRRLKVLDG